MNARGSTEVIIATIGLSMGVLSQNLFSMIVTMAILTTMAMPPMLRAALARLPLNKAEKERLEQEEFEQNGFVANLERLLLAADESANARFASQIAGLLAGWRGCRSPCFMSTRRRSAATRKTTRRASRRWSRTRPRTIGEADEESPGHVDITTRIPKEKPAEAVEDEAKKGFDLLVVGMDKTLNAKGRFDQKIEDIAGGFHNPMAIVVAKGPPSNNRRRPASKSWCRCQAARSRGVAPKSRSRWLMSARTR